MGKQPAVVIICRHGARLDAADKHWHMTSPTPYDPPLTYGGWSQCQSLGARIGSILQTREDEADSEQAKSDINGGDEQSRSRPRKRKRQKVVIHSSPFLRCIQTSVAISAGIGQYEKRHGAFDETSASPSTTMAPHAEEPKNHNVDGTPTETKDESSEPERLHSDHLPTRLRVDAFLGEWLSPDYFENITPPPGSFMMVASAKSELLRPAEDIRGADLSGSVTNRRSSAFSWLGVETGKYPSQSQPSKSRATSFNNQMRSTSPFIKSGTIQEADLAYNPPVPTYAISSSDKIPTGFFAHARDACVSVDYQWDSMHPPLDWGDGGEFGEEWSSMHRRFRNGLQRMLAWYENAPDCKEDEDVILVLVTHGAGCNALIGAMTSAPVLLDVGVASLTMAARKEEMGESPAPPQPISRPTRRGSLDLGISQQFNMKIIASTEHLRVTNPLGLNSPRLGRSPAIASRRLVGADSPEGFSLGDSFSWRPSSSSGLSRNASLRSQPASTAAKSSTGLWSTKSKLSRDETTESSDSDVLPNFDGVPRKSKTFTTVAGEDLRRGFAELSNENVTRNIQIPIRTATDTATVQPDQGLWGTGDSISRSDGGSKRRWTLVDKSP